MVLTGHIKRPCDEVVLEQSHIPSSYRIAGGKVRGHPPPPPWQAVDIGAVGVTGRAFFEDSALIVNGAGAGIGGTDDGCYFVSQWMVAAGEIVVRVASLENTSPGAQAGVMMRDGSQAVVLDVNADGGVEFMARPAPGEPMMFIAGGKAPLPAWMRLTRSRDTFTGAVSSDGRTWTIVGTTEAPLGAVIEVGLVVSSHDTRRLTTSTFDRIVAASQAAQDADIGVVGTRGSSAFDDGVYIIRGSGADIWGTADAFHFLYQSLDGDDGRIAARLISQDARNPFAKAGVMIRESTDADAAHVLLDVKPGGGIEFMTRSRSGDSTIFIAEAMMSFPLWLKLQREGEVVSGYVSPDGARWASIGATPFAPAVGRLVGLAVTSHDLSSVNTARFESLGR
jgi:regulation of enolase protein 1 (concanavalin A-like superfamily)